MRVVVLTTETLHHAYFVRALGESFPVELVMAETEATTAPFDTSHPFEQDREVYESETWFAGRNEGLSAFAPTRRIGRMNDSEAIDQLRSARPDVVVVFGTGKLNQDVIDVCPDGIVNLHGGDPEQYRGLDTHLWAIYHRDFAGLVTTLHRLNAELDDGEIVKRLAIPVTRGMKLHELRRWNTETCVQLVREALADFSSRGCFSSRMQQQRGRYYSFMPSVLKALCLRRFTQHTARVA